MVDKPRGLRYSSEVSHFQWFVGKVRGFFAESVAPMACPPIGLAAIRKSQARPVPVVKPYLAACRNVSCTWETWR